MVRSGFLRIARRVLDGLRSRPDAKVNLAGGLAFEIANPSDRLITMIGANFFDEPTYYEEGDRLSVRSDGAGTQDGAEASKTGVRRAANLSGRARALLETAIEVAAEAHPRDLLAIAHWARRQMHIRATPCVLLAVAAHEVGTKPFVREYCPKIIARADELRRVFATYLLLFGRPLPNSLKRGLAFAAAS